MSTLRKTQVAILSPVVCTVVCFVGAKGPANPETDLWGHEMREDRVVPLV